MTASTNKKNQKKKRKKKKSKFALFFSVLCGVLAVGTIGLAFLATETAAGEGGQADAAASEKEAREEEVLLNLEQAESEETQQAAETEDGGEEVPAGKYDALLLDPERMKEQKIYAVETASSEETVLAFAGDILFDPNYAVMARLIQRGGAVEEAFSAALLERMRGADIFMVNNEFPYSDRGAPTEGKTFTFRAKPESADYLVQMGVDIVSLANNHASDYGEQSLLDSLDTLEALGMPYVGAGRNLEEAAAPVRFVVNDKMITIVSATQIERNDNPDTRGAGENTPGTFRCWNPERLLEEVASARVQSDIVIVYIHWGTESEAQTDWAQRDQAVMIAEAGADIIIGDHSHCLQPVAYVKGVPVIYSLGNFWFNSKTQDTCLVEVTIPAEGELAVRVLPAKQSDCRTALLDGAEKKRVIDYINSISDSAVLDEDGNLSAR